MRCLELVYVCRPAHGHAEHSDGQLNDACRQGEGAGRGGPSYSTTTRIEATSSPTGTKCNHTRLCQFPCDIVNYSLSAQLELSGTVWFKCVKAYKSRREKNISGFLLKLFHLDCNKYNQYKFQDHFYAPSLCEIQQTQHPLWALKYFLSVLLQGFEV